MEEQRAARSQKVACHVSHQGLARPLAPPRRHSAASYLTAAVIITICRRHGTIQQCNFPVERWDIDLKIVDERSFH